MAEALLSRDFGTNGVRAGLFDPVSKRMLGKAMGPYPTRYPLPRHAEQNPADWCRALCETLPRALAEAGDPEVLTVTVATFASTVVAATRAGEVLVPALLWIEAGASDEAAHTATVDHPMMADCGGSDAVEWLVALGAANVLVDLERQGVGIDHVVLSGGIVSNPLWLAATVDAMGKPVELVREENLPLRGDAAAGAAALGHHPNMTAAAAAGRGPSETMHPDPDRHRLYAELLGEYRDAVTALAPILHRLADRAARAPDRGRRPAR